MTSTPRVSSLPPGGGFVAALAEGLLARWPDPLALSRAWILLPNRRACRDLAEAFLEASDGRPLLLPRLLPLGELDADELVLQGGAELPPALSPTRRQLLLTRLIRHHQPQLPAAEAVALATALGQLMDEAVAEDVDLAQLETLVPDDYAAHWQQTLTFLRPVLAGWPAVLAAEGAMSAAARRNALLRAQAAAWRETPPAHPVIVAGSTSVLPAIAELMQAVLTLPQGEVVLPGLPPWPECEAYWDKLEVTHPLAELKELLEKLGVAPASVQPWPVRKDSPDARQLWQAALLPAAEIARWRSLALTDEPTGAPQLALCATQEEEASVIALRLREALTHLGQTALLVTPERNLARRVAEIMRRWEVQIDDSGGLPLDRTPAAVFFRRVALAALAGEDEPVELLTLLKHPLAAAGVAPALCRVQARAYERLRLRPGAALPAWEDHPAKAWLPEVRVRLAPLTRLMSQARATLPELLAAHIAAAEALAESDTESGASRLWQGEGGEALALWLSDLLRALDGLQPVAPGEYETLLTALMAGSVVRPRHGEHPRLAILGPLEAELRTADVVVLGGLNENVWPAMPAPDPWLSRPMRKTLGLQAPERRIGREAHDFLQLASHPEVLLTRAARVDGAPTMPSRWWQRLEALLSSDAQKEHLARGQRSVQWARTLDRAETYRPIKRPAPTPPLAARPTSFSVTRVEEWRRDPYAFYARKILDLKLLDPLEPEADVAERGTFLHAVAERFLRETPAGHEADFMAAAEAVFRASGWGPALHALWWPRLEKLAAWFVAEMAGRAAKPVAFEASGATTFTLDNGFCFTLSARADRLDRAPDGSLVIVDYKSGTLPDKQEQDLGYSAQLPLTALIAENGGFPKLGKKAVSAMEFWKLATVEGGKTETFKVAPRAAIDAAKDGLIRLVAAYADPAMPYAGRPLARFALRYNDYAHLERIKEWSSSGEEDE